MLNKILTKICLEKFGSSPKNRTFALPFEKRVAVTAEVLKKTDAKRAGLQTFSKNFPKSLAD